MSLFDSCVNRRAEGGSSICAAFEPQESELSALAEQVVCVDSLLSFLYQEQGIQGIERNFGPNSFAAIGFSVLSDGRSEAT